MRGFFVVIFALVAFAFWVIEAQAQDTQTEGNVRIRVETDTQVDTESRGSARIEDDIRVRINGREERIRKVEEGSSARLRTIIERSTRRQEDQEKRLRQDLERVRQDDEAKARAVEQLTDRLNDMNARWVEHWGRVLDRLGLIVGKLENQGADVSEARGAIAKAQRILAEQAERVYVPQITDDGNLGQDVRSTMQEMRSDLRSTSDAVREAREVAVGDLIELKSARNEE